jgi:uncharacterized protein
MSGDLEGRLERIVRAAPNLMHVLRTVRDLDLPDWLLFSGAIYQRVLNDLTGRDPDYGVKDYDVAYHDASDLSYEAEDGVIRRVAAAFEPPLRDKVEVRNQARVHLWFEGKFGEPYAPLASSAQSLERFVSPLFAVAVKLDADDRLTVIAPFGLDDLFAMRLRPNPHRPTKNFARTAAAITSRWPEVRIEL